MISSVPAPQDDDDLALAGQSDEKSNFNESWIGRNVFGIAASVLIFIGLLFLGVWAWNNMSDYLKVSMMFVVSGLIASIGIILGQIEPNDFTKILTGCGSGAVFISILVTRMYFQMLNDLSVSIMLIAWLMAILIVVNSSNRCI